MKTSILPWRFTTSMEASITSIVVVEASVEVVEASAEVSFGTTEEAPTPCMEVPKLAASM